MRCVPQGTLALISFRTGPWRWVVQLNFRRSGLSRCQETPPIPAMKVPVCLLKLAGGRSEIPVRLEFLTYSAIEPGLRASGRSEKNCFQNDGDPVVCMCRIELYDKAHGVSGVPSDQAEPPFDRLLVKFCASRMARNCARSCPSDELFFISLRAIIPSRSISRIDSPVRCHRRRLQRMQAGRQLSADFAPPLSFWMTWSTSQWPSGASAQPRFSKVIASPQK